MKCLKCQYRNRPGAKFCKECGARLDLACPKCGTRHASASKFCDECGQDLRKVETPAAIDYAKPRTYTPKFLADKILTSRSAIEGERKLVTVLFADVAHYIRMAEKLDPEVVHQIMDGCFTILMNEIHTYEGTINQFTGDGIMALFGAPVAHEDHAQRACYASLAIQDALTAYGNKIAKDLGTEFKMRIGINSGLVVVGAIGDDLRMDYTAIGDTTNLAARLESLAAEGSVLVSENTKRLAKDYFEFEFVDRLKIEGKEKLQAAYTLIKATEVATRMDASAAKGLTRFIGRKNSIATLNDALQTIKSGRGQVVGIMGEAGVGKSRLIYEWKQALPKNQFTYLEGHCLHYGATMPYLPFIDILKKYLNIKEGESELLILPKIKEKIHQIDETLIASVPSLLELLSLKVKDEQFGRLDPEQKRERLFEALRDLFIRESQSKPLILVIDDLHWMDKMSEQFLDYFIEWLATAPILLLLVYRPEYTHQWGNKSYYHNMNLGQLTHPSSVRLIQAILDGCEIAPALEELILNRASGNPLYMEELTQNLLENGSIKKIENQCVLAGEISEIHVPDTIQGIIAARIDRIEENLKRIMQVASVIGREFAYRILQTITGMREDLKSQLLNLQGLEFIYEKRLFPELEYIFKHALTQEVAYNSLLLQRRKEIHHKIGAAIESLYGQNLEEYYEMLAYHYAGSDQADKALQYLELANAKSMNMCAMEEAKAYFERALRILDDMPASPELSQRRIALLVNQLWVYLQLGKHSEYYEQLTRFNSEAVNIEDKDLQGAYFSRLATCELYFGELEQSIRNHEKALKLYGDGGNSLEKGGTLVSLQWTYLWKGNYFEVLSLIETLLSLNKKQWNPLNYVTSHAVAAMTYAKMGRWDHALENIKLALKIGEELSNNSFISYTALTRAYIQCLMGQPGEALKNAEFAIEKAPSMGNKVLAQCALAWALIRLGDFARGIELGSALIPMFQAIRISSSEIWTMLIVGEGYFLAGNHDEATRMIESAIELAETCGMQFFIGWGNRLLGEIALQTDSDRAPIYLEKSIAVLSEIKAKNERAFTLAAYGRYYKRQGEEEKARQYLTEALGTFERLKTPSEADKVKAELATIK